MHIILPEIAVLNYIYFLFICMAILNINLFIFILTNNSISLLKFLKSFFFQVVDLNKIPD